MAIAFLSGMLRLSLLGTNISPLLKWMKAERIALIASSMDTKDRIWLAEINRLDIGILRKQFFRINPRLDQLLYFP